MEEENNQPANPKSPNNNYNKTQTNKETKNPNQTKK